MIYSKELKLVFIKGRKVAGTSVEILLSKLCGPDDIITPITPVDELLRYKAGGRLPQNYGADPTELELYHKEVIRQAEEGGDLGTLETLKPRGRYQNHNPLKKLIRLNGPIPDDYRTFGVVRSPYFKVISLANMELTARQYKISGRMVATNEKISKHVAKILERSDDLGCFDIHIYQQNGSIPENLTIIRYDQLQDSLRALLVERGVNDPPDLPNAKVGRKSETLDVRKILLPEHIRQINTIFAKEFSVFGFEMLEPNA